MNNLIYVFALISIINLFAVEKKSRNLEIISKVLLMPTLFLSFPFIKEKPILFIVCALYTLGDALLLSSNFISFIIGALSFLAGHIFYYVNIATLINMSYLPFAISAGVIFMLYYIKVIFKEKKLFNYLEFMYIFFVDLLFIFAFATGSAIMAFGGFLFAFSDMLIVKGKNDEMVENSDFKIMFTYILGNFALLFGQALL